MDLEDLITEVVDCCYAVKKGLGDGYLESVYKKALSYELELRGIKHTCESAINVHYKGKVVGSFFADILIDDRIIVELKAVDMLHAQHEVQLVNYLQATGIDTGILVNFGNTFRVMRKYRTYHKTITSY
jgi:GxxExxY protein